MFVDHVEQIIVLVVAMLICTFWIDGRITARSRKAEKERLVEKFCQPEDGIEIDRR